MFISAATSFPLTLTPTANLFCRFSSHLRPYCSPPSPPNPSPKFTISPSNQLKILSQKRGLLRKPSRRRRNALREKLNPIPTGNQDQVRQVSLPPPPQPSKTSQQGCEQSDGIDRSSTNSPLWDKLESWVDRYKQDSEYWGIGASPIFTVYQDPHESVVRVAVDEGEISRRSHIQPLSLAERGEDAQEFNDVSSKIACAKLIVKEIEAGRYMLPRNSSVVKFVGKGKNENKKNMSSLIDSLKSVSVARPPSLGAFTRAGFVLLCGFCVLRLVVNLFARNGKVELKREEVEMLRRKKKSRMEKETLVRGSVNVVADVHQFPATKITSTVRPRLDRDVLMKKIKDSESLETSSSSHYLNANGHDFNSKVREIREMARDARESEREDLAQNDKRGVGSQIDATTYIESKPTEIRPVQDKVSEVDNLEDHEKYIENNTENNTENIKDPIGIIQDDENSINPATNISRVSRNMDNNGSYMVGFVKDIPTLANNSDHGRSLETPTKLRALSNAKIKREEVESINFIEKGSSCTSSGMPARKVPKIIKSVKEARVYLAEKHGISSDNLQPKREGELNLPAAGVTASWGSSDEKCVEKTIKTISEEIKAIYPSEPSMSQVYDPTNAVSVRKEVTVSGVVETNLHEVDLLSPKFPRRIDRDKMFGRKNLDFSHNIPSEISARPSRIVEDKPSLDHMIADKMVHQNKGLLGTDTEKTYSTTLDMENLNVEQRSTGNQSGVANTATFYTPGSKQGIEYHEIPHHNSSPAVTSVGNRQGPTDDGVYNSKELRNFKDKRHYGSKAQVKTFQVGPQVCNVTNRELKEMLETKMVDSPDPTLSAVNNLEKSSSRKDEFAGNALVGTDTYSNAEPSVLDATLDKSDDNPGLDGFPNPEKSCQIDSTWHDNSSEPTKPKGHNSWVEDNFQLFDPIIAKIATGFKENYMMAKDTVQQLVESADINKLGLLGEDEELDWMNDEKLREIVFQVRDNELMGRDPFHLMDAADQQAFFKGLELKAEKVNGKLLHLHEWIHSRIENLDYGRDGISLDDPVEKIIPRWKSPTVERDLEFLNKCSEHQMPNLTEKVGLSDNLKAQTQNSLQKSEKLSYSPGRDRSPLGASTSTNTLIECSDGSIRPGKKMGKEHWQHTKKWSQGFLEVYNAESDPEIKSIMKDMGKDLDKWITEKEIEDASDIVSRITKRKRRYIEKKVEKLKREISMYGTQAVVSKYREYSDEKGEDYLWWLDLQFVLCIELYTVEDGVPKVGFYSLEMAADLELNPKQYHVIAFEDPGDSKNFCYIVQAHMDMLGSGKAYVVARPPKDAFREAKANDFHFTVIRKGEVRFNVDQTLEEVDEAITEIGSKMYHDNIMQERGVDIRTLVRGVVLAEKVTKREPTRKLLKSVKSCCT